MPHIDTIYNWKRIIEGFSEKLEEASQDSGTTFFLEAIEIADTPEIGVIITEKPALGEDGKPLRGRNGKPVLLVERKLSDAVEHRRLRVTTRLKAAGKLNKKYSDKPDDAGGTGPILVFPADYIAAVNRAMGYTGQLIPIGSGEVIEGEPDSVSGSDVLPE